MQLFSFSLGVERAQVADYLIGTDQKIPASLVKTKCLGEVEASLRFCIKPRFGGVAWHKWLCFGPVVFVLTQTIQQLEYSDLQCLW